MLLELPIEKVMKSIAKINIRQIIGDNIRCLRYKSEWSQETLGNKAELHQDYIGRLERGTENISVDNLAKIAAVFKVAPSNLLIERFCDGNVSVDGESKSFSGGKKSSK
jgi:transcriptional regulator with XRE-family HTH domain